MNSRFRILHILTILFAVGCEEPEELPPPAPQERPGYPALDPEPEPPKPMKSGDELCEAFWECSVGCGEIVFGNAFQTQDKKLECLEFCKLPNFVTQETGEEWGQACSILVSPDDKSFAALQLQVCDDGLEFCYHLGDLSDASKNE